MLEKTNRLGQANLLLSLLDDDLREEVISACTHVNLALGEKIVSANEPITHVFFLCSGIASVVVVSRSGKKIEAGVVGREGFVPSGALAGAQTSLTEIIIQVPGDALTIDVKSFYALIARHRALQDIMICAVHVSRAQVECTASSNATQTVTQRLARWLLMCHDRVQGNHLHLTHDFLSTMLAVRRSSVTDSLHILEHEGFIRSERAKITIRNRTGLENYADDLYGLPEEEGDRVFARFGTLEVAGVPLENLSSMG